MISRYLLSGQTVYRKSVVGSFTPAGSTYTSQSYTVQYQGEPGAVLTIKVTSYTTSNPGGTTFKVNGSTYILNDTFTVTLDGSGNSPILTQVIDIGTTTPGNGCDVITTITATTIGTIGIPSTTNISKTV